MNLFENLDFEMGQNVCVAFRKMTPQYFWCVSTQDSHYKEKKRVLGEQGVPFSLLKLLVLL